MADLEDQLRQHYESQQLPDERVRAILAAGRAVAAARARRTRWWLAAAAAVVIGLAIQGGATRFAREDSAVVAQGIVPQDAAAAVIAHFSQPDYQLGAVSAEHAALAKWLRDQGGPASLAIPRAMSGLPSFGCQVLEARGQKVFLICFFLDVSPAEVAPGSMPVKREMVVTAPDGTMMKKNRPLVHLVVAPRAAFRAAPAPGTRVNLAPTGDWNFQVWSQGDLVYMVAAAAPAGRLAEFGQSL
jgi:hypothetical protein